MNIPKLLLLPFLMLMLLSQFLYSQHLSTWGGTRINYIVPDKKGGLQVYDYSKNIVAFTLPEANGNYGAFNTDSSKIFNATVADSVITVTDFQGNLLLTSVKNPISGEEKIFNKEKVLIFRSEKTKFGGYYLFDANGKGLYFTIPDSYGNSGGSLYFYLLALKVLY